MYNDDATDVHDRYNYQHGKWMVIDEEVLLTGSKNLNRSSMPADDKSDGTEGNRGVWLITDAPSAVAHALDVFQRDLDPDNHRDLFHWKTHDPTYGAPPPGFMPDYESGGTTYPVQFLTPLTISGTIPFEIVQSPENSLRDADSLLGMVGRAGDDDTVLVEQMYEYPYWGASDSNPTDDPNPRLEAYIAAARRGAQVRILLDSYYDDPGDVRSNVATCAYVNGIAHAEGLDLACKRANPTGTGIHNKMVLVFSDGNGCVHTGSINGSENSSKNNREFAVQVQSNAGYWYLSRMLWYDWGVYPVYVPIVLRGYRTCLAVGEQMSVTDQVAGAHYCTGLAAMPKHEYNQPCDTPWVGECDGIGCSIPPPVHPDAPWYEGAPRGNAVCEPEYGESRCNCAEDCEQ